MSALLEVEGLRVRLPTAAGPVTVVDGIDYRVEPGEVFGIAGESGSGKTMSVLALMGLLPPGAAVEGRAVFGDRDLLRLPARVLRQLCGRERPNFLQDPMTSINPMLSVCTQLTEDGGSQFLTFSIVSPTRYATSPYRFIVPGVEGAEVPVEVS